MESTSAAQKKESHPLQEYAGSIHQVRIPNDEGDIVMRHQEHDPFPSLPPYVNIVQPSRLAVHHPCDKQPAAFQNTLLTVGCSSTPLTNRRSTKTPESVGALQCSPARDRGRLDATSQGYLSLSPDRIFGSTE